LGGKDRNWRRKCVEKNRKEKILPLLLSCGISSVVRALTITWCCGI
jgi:hypothetical protein